MIRPLGFACTLLLVATVPVAAQRAHVQLASSSGERTSFKAYDVGGVALVAAMTPPVLALPLGTGVSASHPDVPVLNAFAFLPDLGLMPSTQAEEDESPLSSLLAGSAPSLSLPETQTASGTEQYSGFFGRSTGVPSATTAETLVETPPAMGLVGTAPGDVAAATSAPTGLTGAFSVYNFNGLPVTGGSPVTTLYSADGITFAGAYYGPPDGILYGFFSDGALYNYGTGQVSAPSIQLLFSGASTGVAFNYASVDGPSTLTAWLGNTQIGVIQVPTTTQGNTTRYWGFQFDDGTQFDRITIVGNSRGFGLDNLQVSFAPVNVPEPGPTALLLVGALALGAMVEQRRRSSRG